MTERKFWEKWGRRLVSVPAIFVALALVFVLLPVILIITVTLDLFRRSNWAATRFVGFVLVYLIGEAGGILIYITMFIISGRIIGLGQKRLIEWGYVLQRWWGRWMANNTLKLFGIKLDIDEPEDIHKGPLMLFFRHTAMADTILPGILFTIRHKMRIRHIMKRELLWDPCLDMGATRLPNLFVRRGQSDNAKELAAVTKLMEDVQEDRDGIIIFPEGTRFTPIKRLRVLEKLKERGNEYFIEKAHSLKNMLPPRLGGTLAMLQANSKAYAVFCTHVGFEAATKAVNLLNGKLINATIKIKLWKVPFDKIPKTREEQIQWMFDQWQKMDEWVEKHKSQIREGSARPTEA